MSEQGNHSENEYIPTPTKVLYQGLIATATPPGTNELDSESRRIKTPSPARARAGATKRVEYLVCP